MKKIVILLSIFCVTLSVTAQTPGSIEEVHARKWQYMVDKANLSPQQASKVQPIFMEYEKAVWKLNERSKNSFRKYRDAKKNNQTMDYREINESIINMDIQKAQLLKNYYLKLKKVLSDESIFNYLNAERMFRKELMKGWQERGMQRN